MYTVNNQAVSYQRIQLLSNKCEIAQRFFISLSLILHPSKFYPAAWGNKNTINIFPLQANYLYTEAGEQVAGQSNSHKTSRVLL